MRTKQDLYELITHQLTMIAVFFYKSYGVPIDIFNDWMKKYCPTNGHKMAYIYSFKSLYPSVTIDPEEYSNN